jgi:hypothetical protein
MYESPRIQAEDSKNGSQEPRASSTGKLNPPLELVNVVHDVDLLRPSV